MVSRLSYLQAQKGHRIFQLFGRIKKKFPYRYHQLLKKITSRFSPHNPLLSSIYRFGSIYTDRIHQKMPANAQQKFDKLGLMDYGYHLQEFLKRDFFVQASDLIHLHNLHGSYFDLFTLPLLSQMKPIVWTLHDMQALTGHCAHAFSCDKWQQGCGSCPDLNVYPKLQVDTTDLLWRDKKWIYDQSKLFIVSPFQWLKKKVAKSILASHPIEVVPNSVNLDLFKPRSDKASLRKKYKLPQNHILIGCVASGGLANPWKGGSMQQTLLRRSQKNTKMSLSSKLEHVKNKSIQKQFKYLMSKMKQKWHRFIPA